MLKTKYLFKTIKQNKRNPLKGNMNLEIIRSYYIDV